jgi:hypothetical protein
MGCKVFTEVKITVTVFLGMIICLSALARTLVSWVRIPLRAWMFGVCMSLFCVCVDLCLGSGLATGWSLVQGVLPSVKNDYGTEQEAWDLNGLEGSLKKISTTDYAASNDKEIGQWLIGKNSKWSDNCATEVCPWHVPRKGKNKHKHFSQDSRCTGQDSNRTPPEYESRLLPRHQPARHVKLLLSYTDYKLKLILLNNT